MGHPLGNIRGSLNKAQGLLSRSGYGSGGSVRAVKPAGGISPDFKGKGPSLKQFKAGGTVTGAAPKPRLDKFARGGTCKPGTKINVIVAPQGGGMPPPMPMPLPMPPPGAGPGGPPPGPMMGGPPPGAGAMPPGMAARGGRYARGGEVAMDSDRGRTPPGGTSKAATAHKHKYAGGGAVKAQALLAKTGYAHGGKVHMDAGAGGAQGRLDKIKEYGVKPKGR